MLLQDFIQHNRYANAYRLYYLSNSERLRDLLKERATSDLKLLNSYLTEFKKDTKPRVGDYIVLPNETTQRITVLHRSSGKLQANDIQGSFYLGNGYISFSGTCGMDMYEIQTLQPTGKTKEGWVWTFSQNNRTANNAVYAALPFRIFRLITHE